MNGAYPEPRTLKGADMKKVFFVMLALAYTTCCFTLSRVEVARSSASRTLPAPALTILMHGSYATR